MTCYELLNGRQTVSENDPFTVERYCQFLQYLPRGASRILDIGCNTGRGGAVLKLRKPSLSITGLDCVRKRLEQIPKEVYDATIYGFSTQIDAPDNTFDAICAGEFIEHLRPDDVTITLHEFLRVLRPNGRVLLTTPNPGSIKILMTGRGVMADEAHLSEHRPSDLKRLLERVGFCSAKIRGSGKASRYVGYHFPIMTVYGSYLATADKPASPKGTR